MSKKVKAKDISDFKKAAKQLDEIIKRINLYAPDAWVYAVEDSLNLMKDYAYDSVADIENSIVTSVYVHKLDSGSV